ncbi:DUF983 domain-containing protein [Oricola cellulosilytica]|uniref:DUF983 domain-containing protein n=1 Tax=Oricola cellulosilytica TaxID=1429082 RepID=A0A4V2MNQ8_9HYPH|nr:DUF983 domain-containing protein [Oricola cellulosilytica]TCD14117.1 DUF983 domain-containing protein [Oricola cellulosilytica]
MKDDQYPPIPPNITGPRARCPRCGEGSIFTGFLTLKKECPVCGLDLSFADTADGPAFFVMLVACVPVVAFAVWMEVSMDAPYWLNALLTVPLLVLFCILPLRPLKGWLVASQYYYGAREGSLDHD